MRPNSIGWVIAGFFFIAGIVFWIVEPEVGVGQIWIGVSVFLGLLFYWMHRRADEKLAIIKAGIRGQATILSAEQTGMYINNQPRVKLRLRVQTPYSEFEDERTETVPLISLGLLSSGKPLAVYMHPQDQNEYVIDWSQVG